MTKISDAPDGTHMNRHYQIFTLCLLLSMALLSTSTCHAEGAAAGTEEESAPPTPTYPLSVQGPKPDPIAPPSESEIQHALERGVDFLLDVQMKNGAWGSAQRTKGLNIYAPVPGSHHAFRTAVTSLVLMALVESSEQFTGPKRENIEAAIERGHAWLLEHADDLRRADADAIYNVWGHSYAIHAIVRLHARAEGTDSRQAELIKLLEYQVDRLHRYQTIDGGWAYYGNDELHTRRPSGSAISFTTATALIALKEAEDLGVTFSQKRTQEAIASILRQRYPDFAYAYGEYLKMAPRYGINRPGGSLGRSQACNLALRLYGDEHVTDEVLKTWLNRLYARNGWLSIGRKYPVPHESHFAVAGYFYYYGHFYAAMCIDQLPEEDRPYFQDHLSHILLPLQEKDGSWWDYPLYNYHQQYGTAMAVCSLLRCQHDAPAPADK